MFIVIFLLSALLTFNRLYAWLSIYLKYKWICSTVMTQRARATWSMTWNNVISGRLYTVFLCIYNRCHSLSAYAKFSEKLTFLITPDTHTCAFQGGVRYVKFSENFAYVPYEWPLPIRLKYAHTAYWKRQNLILFQVLWPDYSLLRYINFRTLVSIQETVSFTKVYYCLRV